MTNEKFQELLKTYPADMEIKLLLGHDVKSKVIDFDEENILHTSETAYLTITDEDGPEILNLGDGKQYLLLNPYIM